MLARTRQPANPESRAKHEHIINIQAAPPPGVVNLQLSKISIQRILLHSFVNA